MFLGITPIGLNSNVVDGGVNPSWSLTPINAAAKIASGEMTFSRGTLATQVNADGSIGWAPHNFCLYSEDLTNANWVKNAPVTVTPLGGGETRIQVAAGGNYLIAPYSFSPSVGDKVTFAFEVKLYGASSSPLRSTIQGGTDPTVEVTTSPTNSWQLVILSKTVGSWAGTQFRVVGDAPTAGVDIVVRNIRICLGSSVQPYLATTGAPYHGLRVADYSDSPKVPVLGAQILADPNFLQAINTQWSAWGSPSSVVVGNGVQIQASASGQGIANFGTTPHTLQAGKRYRLEARIRSITGTWEFGDTKGYVWDGSSRTVAAAPGTYSVDFVATGGSDYRVLIWSQSAGNTAIDVESISVREITGYVGTTPGIKIEAAATNLFLNSENMSGASWTQFGTTTRTQETLLGVACTKMVGAVGAQSGAWQTVTGANSTTYTATYLVDFGTLQPSELVRIQVNETTSGMAHFVDVARSGATSNVTSATATVKIIAPGVVAISLTFTTAANAGDLQCFVFRTNNGDGVSYFRAATPQIETGSVATSYIPTAGAAVPRGADSLSMPVANVSGWNAAQMTYVGEYAGNPQGNSALVSQFPGATVAVGNGYAKVAFPGVIDLAFKSSLSANPVQRRKVAGAFRPGFYAITADGLAPTVSTDGRSVLTTNSLGFGSEAVQLNGTIYKLDYYPQALPVTLLKELTQ